MAAFLLKSPLSTKAFIRFEKDRCNEMWQTDFKSQFKMADNNYCFPLIYLMTMQPFCNKNRSNLGTANVVISTFRSAFESSVCRNLFYPITALNSQALDRAILNSRSGL